MSAYNFPELIKFEESGVTTNEGRMLKKGHVVNRLVQNMRESGHVPVMDIPPVMHTEYWEEKDLFRFTIAVYGVEVENGWDYEGWLTGRLVPATMQVRSEQFYALWE